MNRGDILSRFRGAPLTYKILAFVCIVMLTAGAYAVFVSGAAPTAVLSPSEIEIYPGESVTFDASDSEGDIISYAWHFHDDNAIEIGEDLTSVSHSYSDEGIYHVTLFVNASNAKMDIATSKVVVKNYAPDIVVTRDSYTVNEDEDITFDASGSTDDSSISSYTWDFSDGDVLYGDVVTHSFTDSGSYNVNLSVEDDRGKSSFEDISVTVNNPVPTADAGDGYGIQEGRPVFLDGSGSTDNPSDTEGMRYRWSNGYVGKRSMEFYGDDGSYSPSVSVRDDDDVADNDAASVNVANTKPKVAVDGAYIKGNLTLRVAGERWHNVELWLYQSGELYGYMNVTRGVASPQTETIHNITFDLTEEWEVYAEYTPEDDPNNGNPYGADPAWVILDFEGGAYRWIQHAFNVVRPDTHEWEVPLNQYFFKPECLQAPDIDQCYGNPIVHFPYKLYDQGADDLTVNWTFSDSYHEEVFPASGFPNFVEDELTFTPTEMSDFNVTVTDDDGASKKIVIKMEDGLIENIAPEVEACEEVTGEEDTAVSFTGDVSDSIGETDFDYRWHFGDGSTANTLDSDHTYQFSYRYPVLLTAKDSFGAEGFDLTWVSIDNVMPTADFNAPSSVNEDGPFTMDASLSSDTVSDEPYLEYEWDMGDGTKEYGINPEHLYSVSGTYTVVLTVRDDDGAEDTLETDITVNNVAPEAYAGPDLMVYGPETEITLRGEGIDTFSDRTSLDYTWDIDGTTLSGRKPKYTFTRSTTYTVYLTVTDDDGNTAQDSLILMVGVDTDIDSMTNELEDGKGTNPDAWDSDFDYVADYWEIFNYDTDPSKLDSDDDGAPDWFEISYMGYNVDTDGDGLVNPWDWDSDGDLISDGDEIEKTDEGDIDIITSPLVYTNTYMSDKADYDVIAVEKSEEFGIEVSVVMDYVDDISDIPVITISETTASKTRSTSGSPIVAIEAVDVEYRSEIRFSYDDSSMTEQQENSLALYRKNSGNWIIEEHTGVDPDHNIVWSKTDELDNDFKVLDSRNHDSDGDGLTDWDERNSYNFVNEDYVEGGKREWKTGYPYIESWEIVKTGGTHAWYTEERSILISKEFYVGNCPKVKFSFSHKSDSPLITEVSIFAGDIYMKEFRLETSEDWNEVSTEIDLLEKQEWGWWGSGGTGPIFPRSASPVGLTGSTDDNDRTTVRIEFFFEPYDPSESGGNPHMYLDNFKIEGMTSARYSDTDHDGYDDGGDLFPFYDALLKLHVRETSEGEENLLITSDPLVWTVLEDKWYSGLPQRYERTFGFDEHGVRLPRNIPDYRSYIDSYLELTVWDYQYGARTIFYELRHDVRDGSTTYLDKSDLGMWEPTDDGYVVLYRCDERNIELEMKMFTAPEINPERQRMLAERHAPILRFNEGETFFPTHVENFFDQTSLYDGDGDLITDDPTSEDLANYPDSENYLDLDDDAVEPDNYNMYSRVATARDDMIVIQYWFFYVYDDKMVVPKTDIGEHEGDWEMIQIELTSSGVPLIVGYSQHYGGEWAWWDDIEKEDDSPIVYVAKGSHASYIESGRYITTLYWEDHYGNGDDLAPRDYTITFLDNQPWLQFQGKWGCNSGSVPGPVFRHSKPHDVLPSGPQAYMWVEPIRWEGVSLDIWP